jgi:hypothetical protein
MGDKGMKPNPIEPIGFDAFWALQLRKEGKLEALKVWKQVTKEYAPALIIAGYQRLLESERDKEPQFRKQPARWLRCGCWDDEPMAKKSTYVSPVVMRDTKPLDPSRIIKSKFLQQFETSH